VLTWKPPTSDAMANEADYWKEEVDVRIDGQIDAVRRLLAALNLVEYVTVSKHRRVFSSTTHGAEVAIDTVEGVGIFVEIEIRSKDVPTARALIDRLATELELRDAMLSTKPYRDLVKDSMRKG
jgi:predicted adenylyl cyclase CyaB